MIGRMRLALALVLTVLVLFTGRLMYLQLARAEEFDSLSRENFAHPQRISPLRGRLLARDGTVLADNRVAYDLMYWGGEIEGWPRLRRLLRLEGAPRPPDPDDPAERRNGAVLAWNLPDRLVPAVEERVAGQANLYLRERVERVYPTGLAAAVVGYTGLADPERHEGYAVDDMIGVSGLEAGLQEALFGEAGQALVETDHRGVTLRREVVRPAEPGRDAVLTLDPLAQRAAEDALAGAARYVTDARAEEGLEPQEEVHGALLAMDPRSGEVLAMASAPTFDPNVFTRRPSDPDAVRALLDDAEHQPLQNRAVEAFPPASTFKLVSSYTLLEHGWITPSTRYACSASLRFGGIRWDNWATYHRGNYSVTEAIADSCNTFYWRAALDTPDFSEGWGPFIRALMDDAHAFGFGERVGLPLPDEKRGRLPDPDFTRAVRDTPWYPGYTLNTSIGQGDVLATPVQLLRFVGTLANRGLRVEPRLVRRIGEEETRLRSAELPGRYWDVLAEGMRRMVTDHGSSRVLGPAADFPLEVAGKTGTAQTGSGADHAWFMAYAPAEDPELALVVFLEHAGSSSATAVPVARDFLADLLDIQLIQLEEDGE